MSPTTDASTIVPERELEDDKKPCESEPPRIRRPLYGWSPHKEDKMVLHLRQRVEHV